MLYKKNESQQQQILDDHILPVLRGCATDGASISQLTHSVSPKELNHDYWAALASVLGDSSSRYITYRDPETLELKFIRQSLAKRSMFGPTDTFAAVGDVEIDLPTLPINIVREIVAGIIMPSIRISQLLHHIREQYPEYNMVDHDQLVSKVLTPVLLNMILDRVCSQ